MTTITIDVTGFEDTLATAVQYENDFMLLRDASYTPKTADEFLQALVTRQLEGLQNATGRIKTDDEARAEVARAAAATRKGVLGGSSVFAKL